jgi:hypothetical protein
LPAAQRICVKVFWDRGAPVSHARCEKDGSRAHEGSAHLSLKTIVGGLESIDVSVDEADPVFQRLDAHAAQQIRSGNSLRKARVVACQGNLQRSAVSVVGYDDFEMEPSQIDRCRKPGRASTYD